MNKEPDLREEEPGARTDHDPGRTTAVAMCIGISAGFALGAVTHNYGLWIPTGASVGAVIGGFADVFRRQDEDKDEEENR